MAQNAHYLVTLFIMQNKKKPAICLTSYAQITCAMQKQMLLQTRERQNTACWQVFLQMCHLQRAAESFSRLHFYEVRSSRSGFKKCRRDDDWATMYLGKKDLHVVDKYGPQKKMMRIRRAKLNTSREFALHMQKFHTWLNPTYKCTCPFFLILQAKFFGLGMVIYLNYFK